MVTNLLKEITLAIGREFPAVKIYTENLEPGAECPYFYIFCVSTRYEPKQKNRYQRNAAFEIQYLPQSGSTENWRIAERLEVLLERISFDGALLQGSNINCKMENGVLHFYIAYTFDLVRKEKNEDYMGEVKVYGETVKTGK